MIFGKGNSLKPPMFWIVYLDFIRRMSESPGSMPDVRSGLSNSRVK